MCASKSGKTCAAAGVGASASARARLRASRNMAESVSRGPTRLRRGGPNDGGVWGAMSGPPSKSVLRLAHLAGAIADAGGGGHGREDHATVLADPLLVGPAATDHGA